MASVLIEIQRGPDWNKLTTVPVPRFPHDYDNQRARQAAMREATRQLSGWQGYFADGRLRIREVA